MVLGSCFGSFLRALLCPKQKKKRQDRKGVPWEGGGYDTGAEQDCVVDICPLPGICSSSFTLAPPPPCLITEQWPD